jgi:hypothetical protein
MGRGRGARMTTPGAETLRDYDLLFNRRYPLPPPGTVPPVQPRPPRPPVPLVPVVWGGVDLSPGDEPAGADGDWFTAVVTNVTGWYASPPLDGHDSARALADGAAWGPKILGAREVVIEGAATGPRARLVQWRDQLAGLASAREPASLEITDPWTGRTLTAMVRAGTAQLDHAFFAGARAFRYSVTVAAADPLLYDRDWQVVTLTTQTAADAGRPYDRLYTHPREDHPNPLNGWAYGSPYPPGSAAYLPNAGNADAPAFALYAGDLTDSRLSNERDSILLAAIAAQQEILVPTATLAAEASGGYSRAEYVLPGSRPLLIPANSTARWHLYAQGSGSVTIAWRSAWT